LTSKEKIEFLEAENKWLWYNHLNVNDKAHHIEVKQYNRKGELIQMSSISLPSKKYRIEYPIKKPDPKESGL